MLGHHGPIGANIEPQLWEYFPISRKHIMMHLLLERIKELSSMLHKQSAFFL